MSTLQNRCIRPFDDAEAVETGVPKYRAQTLSDHQTGLFLRITLEEGGCGSTLHYHHSDQLYFLTRGSVQIRLGDKVHEVATRSLIFIPAEVPHMNRNSGSGTEAHLEMQFPSPHRFSQLGHLIDKPEDVPDEWKMTREAYIRNVERADILRRIVAAEGGPTMHVHEFDQYYFVLEVELTVEVALQTHVAKAENLVVLPAGVPYRQYDAGGTVEKHLTILVPPPSPDRVLDVGVSFEPTGANHAGPFEEIDDVDSQREI